MKTSDTAAARASPVTSPSPVTAARAATCRAGHAQSIAGSSRAHVIAPPVNPPDGEQVIEVRTMVPEAAAGYIAEQDPMLADVLRLADAMGLIRPAA